MLQAKFSVHILYQGDSKLCSHVYGNNNLYFWLYLADTNTFLNKEVCFS